MYKSRPELTNPKNCPQSRDLSSKDLSVLRNMQRQGGETVHYKKLLPSMNPCPPVHVSGAAWIRSTSCSRPCTGSCRGGVLQDGLTKVLAPGIIGQHSVQRIRVLFSLSDSARRLKKALARKVVCGRKFRARLAAVPASWLTRGQGVPILSGKGARLLGKATGAQAPWGFTAIRPFVRPQGPFPWTCPAGF